MRSFALKFIDIMIGIILGLGFQWWPNLVETWQYVAFVFVYLDIIDYWIDFLPALKKFPPRAELDWFLEIGIMFFLFLFIYSTQTTITYFIWSFIGFRIIDTLWLLRAKTVYNPMYTEKLYIDTWTRFNILEIVASLMLVLYKWPLAPLTILSVFIIFRLTTRVLASLKYKKVHFT